MGQVPGHVDKVQEHGEGYSQEEWGALGILEMTVNHPKRLIVEKRGGVGLVLPLRLPTSPPVVPPRTALLCEKVESTSQQSVELVETSEERERVSEIANYLFKGWKLSLELPRCHLPTR